jgi:hypothetical protein
MKPHIFAGLLVTAMVTTGSSLAAAQDHWIDDDLRDHVRDVVRDVRRAVRNSLRDVRRETRHLARDIARDIRHATRDLVEDHAWHVHAATQTAREQARAAREQARAARDRAREQARDARDRERADRVFRQISPSDDRCAQRSYNDDRGNACEVRDTRLPAPAGPLQIDAAPNGAIRVEGWDQADVLVRAIVHTQAETDAEARDLLSRVQVTAAGTTVSADGPSRDRDSGRRRSGWSVSFEVWAPRQTALDLRANNGGVSILGMRGESRFTTRNGGVALDDVAGHVVGQTENGGVTVRLSGQRWDGQGLDVETTNGGVSLTIPREFSAALDVSTVNGGVRTDLPLTVQGRVDRQIRATLGGGGSPLTLRTTNGGVRVAAR